MKKNKTRFALLYEKTLERIIPKYGFFSVIFCFVFNSLIYTGTQIVISGARHFDLTTDADRAIPFIPAWAFVYLGCFLFWAVNYILMTHRKKEEWFQFAAGDYLSRMICGVFFVLLPTTNIRPKVLGNSLSEELIRFIYRMDAPTNLFPSIHCLVSWLCFVGIRGRKDVPKQYQIFSCLFAIAVFASTLFTKQHYIIDVITGAILAEICYYIGHHTKYYQWIMGKFDKLNRRVFGESWDEE